MNCKEVEEGEISELYLLDRLTELERDEFEKHYFECKSCFAQLQTRLMPESRPEPLASSRSGRALQRRMWAWTPAFVAVALLFAVGMWWYSARREASQPVSAPPIQTNSEATAQFQPSSPAAPSLEELARVEAPPYTGAVLRGAEDEAQETFRNAMQNYSKGDFTHAIPGLRAAVKADPRTARFNFYLGACYLLTDQTDLAIESFRRTISLGESSYSEPAHFYLAKAYLRKKDVSAAEDELRATIRLNGSNSAEAADILQQLGK